MQFTNKYNLPQAIVNAVCRDPYDRGEADMSVSDIIDSPRAKTLLQIHDSKLVVDVSERIWSLFGRAVHQILEWGADEESVPEERLFYKLNIGGTDVTISGAMDLQETDGEGRTIIKDWKVTSVYAYKAEKPAWPNQLNCYAHLMRNAQFAESWIDGEKKRYKHRPNNVGGLQIGAILRDWNSGQAKRDPSYPQAPIQMVELPLWASKEAKVYFESRVAMHVRARSLEFAGLDLPPCTDEERWKDEESFAVMKEGGKRALALYDNRPEAQNHLDNLKVPAFIEVRGGTPKRCESWCGAAPYCSQYQKELSNG